MSWVCLSPNKESIARKVHRCDVCDGRIEKGEKQVTRSGVQEGEGFYRMHLHPECDEYSEDWDSGDWESSSPGGISRAEVREALNLPPL